jgi:membrane protease YdiL (CAAX protease family)
MKKARFSFWIPLIAGGIALISAFVVWSVNIYRVTYLSIRGEQYLACGALLLALVPMVYFIRKGRLKGKRLADAVKIYLGFFICSLPVAMFVVFTTAWLLEGTIRPGANLTGMSPVPATAARVRKSTSRN